MNYKIFEELPCWNKARELCQAIFDIINQGEFQKDFSLKDQLWKAAGHRQKGQTEYRLESGLQLCTISSLISVIPVIQRFFSGRPGTP